MKNEAAEAFPDNFEYTTPKFNKRKPVPTLATDTVPKVRVTKDKSAKDVVINLVGSEEDELASSSKTHVKNTIPEKKTKFKKNLVLLY